MVRPNGRNTDRDSSAGDGTARDGLAGDGPRAVPPTSNATDRPYPRDRAVHQLFEELADTAPQAQALEFPDLRLTYRELDARANRLARHLRSLGVRDEDRVGILLGHSGEWIVAALAVLKAGGAYVPLDPGYPAQRLAYMCADAGPAAIVTDSAHRSAVPDGAGPAVVLDEEAAVIAALPESRPDLPTGPRRLAYVMYTSGSTGRPKGVGVEHRNIVQLVCGAEYMTLGSGSVVGQAANVSFDAATFEVWCALLNGGRLVGIAKTDLLSPDRLAARLREGGVNTLFLTTAFAHHIAHESPTAVADLTWLVFGGEQGDYRALARLRTPRGPRHLLNAYGPTEGTVFITTYACDALGPQDDPVPIGFPITNARVHVLDQRSRPVPPGTAGELFIGGDGVARGYLGRPALTAERFVPDPFGPAGTRLYRTGDLVRQREDGALVFLGRADRQIKIRGRRIELGEIESCLLDSGRVAEVTVQVRPGPDGESQLLAYVVPVSSDPGQGQQALDAEALAVHAHAREQLPDYLVPGAVLALSAFPLTANGKIDVAALPEPDFRTAARAGAGSGGAPQTRTQQLVADVWTEVLGVPGIGLDEDFLALGGHSLAATRIVSRLSAALAVPVTVRVLFANPTVAGTAAALSVLPRAADPTAPGGVPDTRPLVAVAGRGTKDLADLLAAVSEPKEGLDA